MSSLRRTVLLAACCAVPVLSAGMAESALAGFAPAKQLSEPVASISSMESVVDAAGDSTAVWEQNTTRSATTELIMARRLAANGSLGPFEVLSTPGVESFQPAVGGNAAGATFAAWRVGTPSSIDGRWINPDGTLGPIVTILTGGASEDGVAIDVVVSSVGTATVGWYNQAGGASDRIELRRVEPNSTEGEQVNTTLSAVSNFGAAALPSGATFIVSQAMTDVIATNGTVAAPVSASTSGAVSTLHTGIAFDAHGDGLVAWRHGLEAPFSLIARRIGPEGMPIGSEIVVEPPTPNFLGASQFAAVDSNAHFLVGWDAQDVGNEGHAYARAVNADGSLPDVPQAVSGVAEPEPEPLLALDDRGSGIAAFDFFASGASSGVVQGQLLSSTAHAIGEPAQLSGGSQGGLGSVANDPGTGVASVLWVGQSLAHDVLLDSRFMEPPSCTGSTATVLLGRTVNVPLACSGVGINNARIVAAPAHGKLGPFNAATQSVTYTPTPGYQGPDSFVYEIENDGAASTPTTVQITVNRAPVTATRPVVTKVAQTHTTWREGTAQAVFSKRKPPIGTIFSFAVDQPAGVRFAFTQRVSGRKVGHRCVARTPKNHRHKLCRRTATVGALAFTAHGGRNSVAFQGRLSHRSKLRPGHYKLVITATNAAGQTSAPQELAFAIVK